MVQLGKVRYSPKKSRGNSFSLDAVGRAVLLYQSSREGSAGSTLGQAGMPSDGGSGDGDGFVNLVTEIGRCIDMVRRHEHKQKKGSAPTNTSRLEQRFQAYSDMLAARNELPYAEYRVSLAYSEYSLGEITLEAYQEIEEWAEQLREKLRAATKLNDRYRRGRLYTEEVGIMNEQLRLRGIKI